MARKGCSISEAAKRSGVEAYVLRYWEEEGLFTVPRDDKGHRFYTEKELTAIHSIQLLKKEGLSIKHIRNLQEQTKEYPDADKIQEIEKTQIIQDAKNTSAADEATKQQQFYSILERLVKEIAMTRKREERYRRLDQAIRRQQEHKKAIK